VTDYNQNLRYDRRLLRRRGWLSAEDVQRKLDSLPDVSEKIQPPEEEESPGEGATGPGDAA
jgi:hypothetical protein